MNRPLYITLLLLLPVLVFSQNRQYVFNRLSTRDGLASNVVNCILQDNKGFMWFATASGLQRYDGKKVIMFRTRSDDSNYLPNTAISQIFEDAHQHFWIRADKEVGIFDPVTFRYRKAAIQMEQPAPPRSESLLWSDKQGNIFLIVTGLGILVYDPGRHLFLRDDSRLKIPDGWSVSKMFEDPISGDYWLASDSGLALYDRKTKEVYHAGYNPKQYPVFRHAEFKDPVTTMLIDQQDRFWVVTWNVFTTGERFYCYDRKRDIFLKDTAGLYEHENVYTELHRFFEQENGKIWAYGLMRLNEYREKENRFIYLRDKHIDDYGIRFRDVHCIYEDHEANLWLGTDEGVYFFNPGREKFHHLSLQQEHPVNSILETKNGAVFLGTWGNGTVSFDSNFNPLTNTVMQGAPLHDRSYSLQWDMHQESQTGMVWIGCQGGRLILYDPGKKRSSFYNLPQLENRTIRQVMEDAKGNIWLGGQYGRLLKWDRAAGYGNAFTKGFSVVQNFGTIIYKIKSDRDGNLWVCTHMKGLYRIDPVTGKTVAHYNTEASKGKSLSSDIVADIAQYNDSLFFVAAGQLNILNIHTGDIQQVQPDDGLPVGNIISLELDNDSMLWMGTPGGIYRYNYNRNYLAYFTQRDGLIKQNFVINASLKMRNGQLVFGNPNGAVYFQPRQAYGTEPPIDVTITDFKLFNNYLPPDSIMKLDEVRLKHNNNSITIEFATLSFLNRDKIVYYYKMDGLDKDWIRTDRGQYANYNLLPSGHYTFMVMCENADGIESDNITTLSIYIEPPFWRTWWFIALMILCVLAAVYLLHRMRINQLLGMEKVRTRIARDLHDDMGSTLSTINILSEMAKMKVSSDTNKTAEYLVKISDNSSRMMEAMDDIVWSINPTNDTMQRITARMREFATGVLEAKNIEFNFRVDDAVNHIKLDMEARRDLFLIFKEAVNNLAKYSCCTLAAVDISVLKNRLLMQIEDNGTGFNTREADSGNGLVNMKKRAQSLKGTLEIESREGKGTKVILEIPLT